MFGRHALLVLSANVVNGCEGRCMLLFCLFSGFSKHVLFVACGVQKDVCVEWIWS